MDCLQLTNISLWKSLRGNAVFPVCDLSVPTLIISDCEVWIYALLRHHREIEMVSFNRLIWIKSAESLNYLRDQRKKRNNDKIYKIYDQTKPWITDLPSKLCTDSSCFRSSLSVIYVIAWLHCNWTWSGLRNEMQILIWRTYTRGLAERVQTGRQWIKKHQSVTSHTHLSRLCSLADIRSVISGEPRHVVVYVQHFDERRCGGG